MPDHQEHSGIFATPLFAEVQGRIDRARDLHVELVGAIEELVETTPLATRTEHDSDAGMTQLIVRLPSLPLRYALIVSDIAHQLRSALDNLVFLLLEGDAKTLKDQEKIEFLIRSDAKKYPNKPEKRQLLGASAELRRAIWDLQPFRSDSAASQLLGLIHDVNRMDKHRHLAPVTTHSVDELNPAHVVVTPIDPIHSVTRLRIHNAGAESTEFPLAAVIVEPKSARVELAIGSSESFRLDVVFGKGPRFSTADLESAIDAIESICVGLWDDFGQEAEGYPI